MINIITHGDKKFKGKCFTCNCEFTYELEDILNGTIICPDCNHAVNHYPDDFVRGNKINAGN